MYKVLGTAAALSAFLSLPALAHSVTVEHRLGKTTVETNPERVVVIGLGALDAVDSLGVEPVAVAKFGLFPDYLAKYKTDEKMTAGSFFEPDFESIYSQKPDLIVIGPRASGQYEELSKIAPTVVFAAEFSSYWESTQAQWRNLGKIFEAENVVEDKIEKLNKDFKAIKGKASNTNALTVLTSGGKVSTFGAESRFSAIYKDFGFKEAVKNLKTSTHGDQISFEFIQEANPETLLIIDRDQMKGKGKAKETLDNDLVKATEAYKNNKLSYLDTTAWYLSISGVRATEQMVTDIKQSVGL
ncbi:siderophore ABC transporter substrate-binding protein [Veronia nyctiphanis]|uniref:Siderophore ABC transporter substrate-binding protein n=1 Tax=Veronia nyctiphanis TaxID=1278244 RepID=A0A4Q0YSB9_9GAMM|nr:siderophore ABC transporter substrate-binding protein [Veronia nyctiphanis]RXJ74092.1 siderophore ABC transporter substrate-binding protein [Veronia nyctiphanis]